MLRSTTVIWTPLSERPRPRAPYTGHSDTQILAKLTQVRHLTMQSENTKSLIDLAVQQPTRHDSCRHLHSSLLTPSPQQYRYNLLSPACCCFLEISLPFQLTFVLFLAAMRWSRILTIVRNDSGVKWTSTESRRTFAENW